MLNRLLNTTNDENEYHLEKLIIQNFKQFQQRTEIMLTRLTVLVGPNGSGKSSIITAMELLALSIEFLLKNQLEAKEIIERLNFDEFVSSSSKNRKSFSLSLVDIDGEELKIEFRKSKGGGIKIHCFEIGFYINPTETFPSHSNQGSIVQLKIFPSKYIKYNKLDLRNFEKDIRGKFILNDIEFEAEGRIFTNQTNDPGEKCRFIKTEVKSKDLTITDTYLKMIEILGSVLFSYLCGKSCNEERSHIKNVIILLEKNNIDYSKEELEHFFMKVGFTRNMWFDFLYSKFDDTRQSPPEYFEYKNGKFTNDYYGLCEFLFKIRNRKSKRHFSDEYESFFESLRKLEIADDLVLSPPVKLNLNLSFYSVYLIKDGSSFNLTNLSSGGKQLLPVLLELFASQRRSYSSKMISQPELHLHPKLQAVLADILADYVNIHSETVGESLILETHSEHLIRKLQILVAKGLLFSDSIAIYYIKPELEKSISKAIHLPMNAKGLFTKNWPDGFFNDATILTLDLLEELTKRQN